LRARVLSQAARERLSEIELAGERAATLTRQLLAFSRQQVLDLAVLDVDEVMRGLERLLGRRAGRGRRPQVRGESATGARARRPRPARAGDDEPRGQTPANAMPHGGKLTIETSTIQLDEVYARARHLGVDPGPYVLIAVSDTGVGMDKDTQARAFEPFFTTKELGKGTGLGLATVFGIVQQSRGSIWLYSEPGVGTTFKIYLRRVLASEPTASAPRPRAEGGGRETILLVEDEEMVRKVTYEILTAAGYRVVAAKSPEDALALARTTDPLHLLLTRRRDAGDERAPARRETARAKPGTASSSCPGTRMTSCSGTACSIRRWRSCKSRSRPRLCCAR
jgi:CheY-like chemotaxis protein